MQFKAWRGLSDGYRTKTTGHSPWKPDAVDPRPLLVPDVMTDAALEELRDVITSEGIRALAFLPLVSQGRLLGKFMLYYEQPHDFSQYEEQLAVAVAGQVAFAIDRLHTEEELVRSQQRTLRLQTVTARLSEASTPADVVEVVAREGMGALSAESAIVAVLTPDRSEFEIVFHSGYEEEVASDWSTFPADAPLPFADAVRLCQPILLTNWEDTLERYPALGERAQSGQQGHACVPIFVERRGIGAIAFGFTASRQFSDADQQFMAALGRQCGQALERARLYEAEQHARSVAERARNQQTFLAQASEILSSSLDYEETMGSLAHLCVPYVADWCAVDIQTDDGSVKRVAVVHSDPAKVQFAHELYRHFPPDPEAPSGLYHVLRTGTPEFHPDITDELIDAVVKNPEVREVIRQLGLRSSVSVPLVARGRTLGVLTLVMAESDRRYGDEELTLAMDLARRAGLAVDNARLYSQSQSIQEELRRANEAKDEFLGLVSHELRTPVTTIYGGAHLLKATRSRPLAADERESVIADIQVESERLRRIVEDLLVLARLELGQEVAIEPVLVQRVLERTAASFERRRPGRPLQLAVEPELSAGAASPVYLEQVLENLLNNADKYSPPEKPVELAAQRSDGHIIISVRDHGPGLPPEDLDRIFERFYRSQATSKHAGGAGIGLTVCKRLVEAQGGEIWASVRESGGLDVSFSLPFADAEPSLGEPQASLA